MKNGFRTRYYIEDFVEDLNHKGIILYIGHVDVEKLRVKLEKDMCNKMYRLNHAIDEDVSDDRRNFIYISNCDLQNLDYPIQDYMMDAWLGEEYSVHNLYHDDETEMFILKVIWSDGGKGMRILKNRLFRFDKKTCRVMKPKYMWCLYTNNSLKMNNIVKYREQAIAKARNMDNKRRMHETNYIYGYKY